MGDEEWLYDDIMGFLRSPLWSNPILSFIDENCVVFDTDDNKLEYTEIHNKFSSLIENLLEKHLSELGVTQKQFITVCQSAKDSSLTKTVAQNLLAMDDYIAFKKMMQRRYTELQLETLKFFKMQGKKVDIKTEEDVESDKKYLKAQTLISEEERQLREAIAASIKDQEMKQVQDKLEAVELEQSVAMSMALTADKKKASELIEEHEKIMEKTKNEIDYEKKMLEDKIEERKAIKKQKEKETIEIKKKIEKNKQRLARNPKLVPLGRPKPIGTLDLFSKKSFSEMTTTTVSPSSSSKPVVEESKKAESKKPTAAEMEKRRILLIAQRDMIIAKKKQSRIKEEEAYLKQSPQKSKASAHKKKTVDEKQENKEPSDVNGMSAALFAQLKHNMQFDDQNKKTKDIESMTKKLRDVDKIRQQRATAKIEDEKQNYTKFMNLHVVESKDFSYE